MTAHGVRSTPALARLIEQLHDGASGRLLVSVTETGDVVVTRADGSELSDLERRRVTGAIAAHRAEPLT